ncbi:AAA family ATPase [Streptomyces sp. YC504]|uniref:AAA family ATPase n=1 Tax=Streptomyces mesophilus TaxID=1775132 RepID=A0A6G4X9A5_9ACTN|nr:AAA family ATPase [Streptomyces mesophilus]NGO74129.1 AAA family ATPase [Streptomyces mesophilus]
MSGPAGPSPAPQLSLNLLGGFAAVREDGVDIPRRWRRSTAQTLVKLLAVAPGLRRHREHVMDLLWPGVPMEAAARNLRVTLHAARHALEPDLAPRSPSSYLLSDGDLLLLAPGRVRVDTEEAEVAARTALASGDADALAAVVEVLRYELLPEDRYADWAAERRRHIEVLRERLVRTLAERLLAAGRTDEAVDVLLEAVERTPTDEAAHLLLARTWCRMGRPRQAIRQYHACREALADELGMRPGTEFENVHRDALAALDAPSTRAAARPVPLPAAIRRPEPLPLFGRERPLDLLVRHATSNPDDTPLVVLRGEAGIGKTRLAAEAARRAAEAGVQVLWGTGHEAEGQTPYGVFADALDGHLVQCGADERARLSAEHVGLAALVPALGAGPLAAATPEEERARLFRAVDGVLADLASGGPVLVVLDDLHAADIESLGLLHHLVRTTHTQRRRFIATYRDDMLEPDAPRRHVLDGINRQRMAVDVDLLRLSRADCAGLASAASNRSGRDIDRKAGSQLFRLSLGNPLFALELATGPAVDLARLAPAYPTPGEPVPDAVPDNIRRLVRGRLARLPDDTRRILHALSLAAGAAVSLTAIEAVAERGLHPPLSGPEVTVALDAAVLVGVIEERDVVLGGRSTLGYAFRHPLVRLACAEQMSRASRRRIHQAYADVVLRLRPDAVDALAHHMTLAEDARAPVHLRAAADRAASLFANDSACAYYRELVDLLDARDPSAAPEARLAWGLVLRRAARYAEAEAVLRRAYDDLMAAADHVQALRVAVSLAEALGRAGRPLEGLEVLEAAPQSSLSEASDRAGRDLACGALNFNAGRYDEALAALGRAEDETVNLDENGRAPLRARLFTIRAAAHLVSGRLRESRAATEEALRTAEATQDATLLSGALSVVGELAREEGRVEDARDIARRAVTTARRTGDPTLLAFDQSNLAGAELLAGDQVRATALSNSAVRLARSLGPSWVLPYALVCRAEVELRCGRLPEAEAALEECAEAVELTRDPQVLEGMRRLSVELSAARSGSRHPGHR